MRESPLRSLAVLLVVALVCSVLVSLSAVILRPIQAENERIERYRQIVVLAGLIEDDVDDAAIAAAVERLEVQVVNLDTGEFSTGMSPEAVNARRAASDPALSTAIPEAQDSARIGRRSRYEVIFLVRDGARLSRVILPVHGQGMWSTLYGLVALKADLNTIAAATFYEQAETAGLGDQIEDPAWLARWSGRRIFGPAGDIRFQVAAGPVEAGSPAAAYQVDGLSGATITGNAVTALVRFWFGPYGYGPLLEQLGGQEG